MHLIDVMPCPLLLARQQAPDVPSVFASHSLCGVPLSAVRSAPATQAGTAANTRKVEIVRENFISCCLGKREKKTKSVETQNSGTCSATKQHGLGVSTTVVYGGRQWMRAPSMLRGILLCPPPIARAHLYRAREARGVLAMATVTTSKQCLLTRPQQKKKKEERKKERKKKKGHPV